MDESALNPVVQEALAISRKVSRFLTVDATVMSYAEFRSLWDSMLTDRSFSASFLVCLITKGLILNNYEVKPELTESLLNMMTSKPLVAELERSRTSSSVKNEMRRQMDLRIAILNSIYYVILHYPIDVSHYSVKKAYTTWTDDLDKNKGTRELFENELCNLLSSNDKTEGEQSIKDLIYRCANISVKQDLADLYNSNSTPTNRALGEAFLFSFLLNGIHRGPHRQLITSTVTQLLTNWATISDLKYYALVMMLREFLLRDQSLSPAMIGAVYDAVKPFYIWPAPFCNTAKNLLQYLDFRRRSPAATNCLDFLSDHPELLSKSKQEEFIHVVINDDSLYGQAMKDILGQSMPPSSPHTLKAKFLQFFYKAYFEGETEIWDFATMDQIIVNALFTKAVDLTLKVASANGALSKNSMTPKLKEFKQTIEDHIASLGGKPSKDPAGQVRELEIGYLPFTVSSFENKEFSFHDKGHSISSGEEIPDSGGYQTLEKIVSQYTARTSPTHLKIVVCGGDATVSGIAWGYTILRNTKPDLFKLLTLSFYIIPTGSRNRIASCVSLFDHWYGRQVSLATRSIMWVLPSFTKLVFQEKRGRSETLPASAKDLFERKDISPAAGVSPPTYVRNMVDHYLRHGNVTMPFKVYFAEIWAVPATGSAAAPTRRVIPFLQSVEVGYGAFNGLMQRAENPTKFAKRASMSLGKPTKFIPPEVSVKFTEVDVAGVPHPGPSVASKAYWSIQVSNIPRTTEYEVVKPFSNCLELHLLDLENGRKIRGKPTPLDDGPVHYVNLVEVEDASKRTFEIIVDGEPMSYVSKLRIYPAADACKPLSSDGVAQSCEFPIKMFLPTF